MDDSRIYLGLVCGWRNEGRHLLEDVWGKKIFLQGIPAPYACIACSRFLGSIYTHDLDIFIILRSTRNTTLQFFHFHMDTHMKYFR